MESNQASIIFTSRMFQTDDVDVRLAILRKKTLNKAEYGADEKLHCVYRI